MVERIAMYQSFLRFLYEHVTCGLHQHPTVFVMAKVTGGYMFGNRNWHERSFALDNPMFVHESGRPFVQSQMMESPTGWESESHFGNEYDFHSQRILA